jgi:hypothetical protein
VNCIAEGQPAAVAWDDFPAATVERVLSWAHLETRAALVLLRAPATSPAAEILLRGLLEALAHLAWIQEARTPAEQRCRALCYELGRTQSYADGLRKMGPDAIAHLPADTSVRVEADLDTIRQLHGAAGCRCRGRHEGLVEADLKGLAQAVGQPYVYELWVTSSRAAHQFAFDRIARSTQPGITAVSEATLADRGRLLTWVVAIYGYVGQMALLLENPGQRDRFNRAISRFTKSRALLGVVTGATRELSPATGRPSGGVPKGGT